MKDKLKEYINEIFADAPAGKRTNDLKEELYSNVCDRYDDLILDGKSEAAAYNICIAGVGDVSHLIDEIRRESSAFENGEDIEIENAPKCYTTEEVKAIEKYRARSGVMGAIGVALYILCWVPLVLMSSLSELSGVGNVEIAAILGLVIMMLMIAVATALMILKSAIKPMCLRGRKDIEELDEEIEKQNKKTINPALKVIKGCLWPITFALYFIISFSSGAWYITWIIFLIATAVENIIDAIFEIVGKKYL